MKKRRSSEAGSSLTVIGVIENLAGSVEQALNQTLNITDLSNNNVSTAFGYTLQFPHNS